MKDGRWDRGRNEDVPSSKSPGRIPLAIHQHQHLQLITSLVLFDPEEDQLEPLDKVSYE